MWNIAFKSAFLAFNDGNYAYALRQCRHFIRSYSIADNSHVRLPDWHRITDDLELSYIEKDLPDCDRCMCPIPNDVDLARWFCLKVFILFRLVEMRKIGHELENVKRVKDALCDTVTLIRDLSLESYKEFIYLQRECGFKVAILIVDYMSDPWDAYTILKYLRRSSHHEEEHEKLNEYYDRCTFQCMMWYLKQKKSS